MKRILLGLACALVLSTAAQANPFDSAYGNTVTQTLPDGTKFVIYVNADGTWQSMSGGKTTKGTFVWKDATNVCFTQVDPAPADASKATMCNEVKGDHKVGDTWTETTPDGKTKIDMAITAGR